MGDWGIAVVQVQVAGVRGDLGKNSRFHLYRQIAMASEIEPQKPRYHV